MEIKSGKGFYIGDICYVLGNDDYYRFWGKQKRFAEGAFEIPGKGYAFAVGFTAYGDGVYSATLYVPETIDPAELLELAYKEAKDKGANGIVNYKTQILTRTDVSHGISSTTVEAYIITGFLIKILD